MAERGSRKVRIGQVATDAMDKTVVVKVESHIRDPLYKKTLKRTKKFKVHDETNQAKVGDIVKIMETRPLSKTKRWRVVSIIEKAK